MQTQSLRDYQIAAIDAIRTAWQEHDSTLLVLPTGTGKTRIATALPQDDSSERWLFIAHRHELLEQIYNALVAARTEPVYVKKYGSTIHARDRRVGRKIGMASGQVLRDHNHRGAHVVASVQWLDAKERNLNLLTDLNTQFTHLVIDEAHHTTAPSYRAVINRLREQNPALKVLGLTATPLRHDGTPLAEAYDSIAYHQTIRWFVERDWLVPARAFRVMVDIDLSRASISEVTRDYIMNDEMLSALDASNWLDIISDAMQRHVTGRRTIAFCASVRHSQRLSQHLCELGFRARHLDAESPPEERAAVLAQFRAGELDVLTNVQLFTEGFDLPAIDAVVMARPTKSALFYIQAVGRALRPADGKEEALILDFGSKAHSLVQLADLDGSLDLRQAKEALTTAHGYSSVFYDEVFLSLAQRRAILQFTAGNEYEKALDLLQHPALAWASFDDCAILDVNSRQSIFVLSPQRASVMRGRWRSLVADYAALGLYSVLLVDREGGSVAVLSTGFADDVVISASTYGQALATKIADARKRWRQDPASWKQIGFARRLGLDPGALEGLTKGEVSQIISYTQSCRALGVPLRGSKAEASDVR